MGCHANAKLGTTCMMNFVNLWKQKKPMKLFPANPPSEYVEIDILAELITSKGGYQYLLAITDPFTKLILTVP